ncbi:MAG TPA: SEC-C metal-binding domain-containing protein [Burkholderiales bacterium]|nr:SEC-C metal-binding domain-containing protein [Burkholderiales bacterium]
MRGDEDRVPRSVIDECARRGEEMVGALEEMAGAEHFWKERADLGDWWLRLHAAMILGLVPSERAGLLLVSLMRRIERAGDDNLEDWLSGYWPALFRNKPEAVVPPLRELAQDRNVDWYMRIQAVESVIASGERAGAAALEAALDWAAGIAAEASEDEALRLSIGNNLLDFPRERHRALLESLATRQSGPTVDFTAQDVRQAFAGAQDTPHWRRFDDPWKFYAAEAIARRQERWAKEDAESADEADEDFPFDQDESFASEAPYFKAAPKIGRNDPCPCGSGQKYKRCCLAKAQAEPVENLAWRRLRRLLDEYQRDMLRFVTNSYGRLAIEEAWRHFVSDDEAAFDPESPHLTFFMPWFYHRWSPDAGESRVRDRALHSVIPTAAYLQRKKRLDPLLREYLESCLAAPFSAFEILRADPGRRLAMKDLFTGAEHDVSERSASATMQEGDLVFGQVVEAGGVALLEASQGFAIPPIWKIKVIELRHERFGGAIAVEPKRLRQAEGALLVLYDDIATQLFERKLPVMQNTDGESLSLRRVVFEVPSAQEAFDALKHLALEENDADLLRDAVRDPQGKLVRAKFSWLKRGNAQNPGWENTVLGSLEIDGTRLSAEVNSEQREKRLRAIVAEALGKRSRHRATEIQSVDKLLAEAPAARHPSKESAALAELPEVKAKIAEMMAKHYERWVNEKIPALGGRTPIEAIADPAGREAVEALVRQIERDGARMTPPLAPGIAQRLRERLGLR